MENHVITMQNNNKLRSKRALQSQTAFLDHYQSPLGLKRAIKIEWNRNQLRRLGEAWGDARHAPTDDVVRIHYKRLSEEVELQFNLLTDFFDFELTRDAKIYPALRDLIYDADKGHVYVFDGTVAQSDHPLSARTEMKNVKRRYQEWTLLQMLRAVHEVLGHAVGNKFTTEHGELDAFDCHRALFTEAAWPALTSEFLGPLCWLNHGPHKRYHRGEKWELSTYPDQKSVILPRKFWDWNSAS